MPNCPHYYGGWYGGGYSHHHYYHPGRGYYGKNNQNFSYKPINNVNNNIYNKVPWAKTREISRDKLGNVSVSPENKSTIKPVLNKIVPITRPTIKNDIPSDRIKIDRDIPIKRDRNNVIADKEGNWNQNNKGEWRPAPQIINRYLDKIQQSRDRSGSRENMINNNAPIERQPAPQIRQIPITRPPVKGKRF